MARTIKIYLRIGEAAQQLGVTPKTIRRWEKKGKINTITRTEGNHRRFSVEEIERMVKKQFTKIGEDELRQKEWSEKRNYALVYGRVSTVRQKEDLERQLDILKQEAEKDNYSIIEIYSDIGSGLNDNRKGLKKMLKECLKNKEITRVYITFRDRLARFGTRILEELLQSLGIELKVINEKGEVEKQEQLLEEFMQDFMGIFTSFTGKWYGMRKKWKKIEKDKEKGM